MKRLFKILSFVFVTVALTLCFACSKNENITSSSTTTGTKPSNPTVTVPEDKKVLYTFVVKATNGKTLRDFVIGLELNGKIITEKLTDKDGYAEFSIEGNEYNVIIDPSNAGYIVQDEYTELVTSKTSEDYEIICDTQIVPEEAPTDYTYVAGEAIYDFTLKEVGTNENINLSKLFENGKKVVMLNFWYMSCSACMSEFPCLNSAYETKIDGTTKYSDELEIICINPGVNDNDTPANVLNYKLVNDFSLTFAMDNKNSDGTSYMTSLFGIQYYPTTIIIDKYGTISQIHIGAITEINEWTALFDEYISANYEHKFTPSDPENGTSLKEPNVQFPNEGVLEAILNGKDLGNNDLNIKYRPYSVKENDPKYDQIAEEEKYSWPFIPSEDGSCVIPSNVGENNSFAIMYTDVALKAGEVLSIEYFASCEKADYLYVFIDGQIVAQISGLSTEWETIYLYPAIIDGTYELAFSYIKDDSISMNEDVVKLRNIHIVTTDDIDRETYILREASYGEQLLWNMSYEYYITPVYNENDGYYHVNSIDGPLLLADLASANHWSDTTLNIMSSNELLKWTDGDVSYDYNLFIKKHCGYLSNSTVGYIPITEELKNALVDITKHFGDPKAVNNQNQWLELCVYYDTYATDGELGSTVVGVAPFDPYYFTDTSEGDKISGTSTGNYAGYYLPRGIYFEFKPTVSGVYKFYSVGSDDTLGWVFDSNDDYLAYNDIGIRPLTLADAIVGTDSVNFVSYYYYEAGKTYYIKACFDDQNLLAELTVNYEYVASNYELFKLMSEAAFTSSDADMSDIISGGVGVKLVDGYYHADTTLVGEDSFVYVDFKYSTSIFGVSLEVLAENGGFDMTKDEEGNILTYESGNPMFDESGYLLYEDGTRVVDPETSQFINWNYTTAFYEYMNENMITDENSVLYGCAKVTEEFAEILQLLMDKYTFAGIENSWNKLCYYYAYIGA
ncbi:MAG: TlpA family protein disulfide reductase [Anaeroplasma sp.]